MEDTTESTFSLEKIIAKIRLLQATATHPSTGESERMAAIAAIKKLADKYAVDLSEVEKDDAFQIVEKYIRFKNAIVKERSWMLHVISCVVDFLNAKPLGHQDHNGNIIGVFIVGVEMDVEAAYAIAPTMIAQAKKAVQDFYADVKKKVAEYEEAYAELAQRRGFRYDRLDWNRQQAILYVNQKAMAKAPPMSFRMMTRGNTMNSSNSGTTVNYVSFASANAWGHADVLEHVAKRMFLTYGEMPTISSAEWIDVERDWGQGCVIRMHERLHAEDKKEPIQMGSRYEHNNENALITISDQVHLEKMSRIDEHLKDAAIDTRVESYSVKDKEVFEAGMRKADELDLSGLKQK